MFCFWKKQYKGLETDVCGMSFRHPLDFTTLTPPQTNVLQWITDLRNAHEKRLIAVSIKSDIVRTFSLVYDFGDLLIVDPDSANSGIAGADLSDTMAVLDELLSLRLCYERYRPIWLKLSVAMEPEEARRLLDFCRYSGIDGVVLTSGKRVKSTIADTQGRLPVMGIPKTEQEALQMIQDGASLLDGSLLSPLARKKVLRKLEKKALKAHD